MVIGPLYIYPALRAPLLKKKGNFGGSAKFCLQNSAEWWGARGGIIKIGGGGWDVLILR